MKRSALALLPLLACSTEPEHDTPDRAAVDAAQKNSKSVEREDLEHHFARFERSAFLLRALDGTEEINVHSRRLDDRLAPCSTFKIFNALAGLDAGVLHDATTTFAWDRTKQPIRSWARDHDLASAIENSVLWYFQKVARKVGVERMHRYLVRETYGNAEATSSVDRFWLTKNSLKISTREQVDMLSRLFRDELAFRAEHMQLVRSLLVLERDEHGNMFSGKTGSGYADDDGLTVGWFVGHVEHDGREYVFATHVRGKTDAFGKQARAVTRTILHELDLWH